MMWGYFEGFFEGGTGGFSSGLIDSIPLLIFISNYSWG